MTNETFISYRSYRWAWINGLLVAVMILGYLIHRPMNGPSGSTVIGYLYGVIATAGILYLMWFGVRKRSYHAKRTTLKGCLSAHVWLGVSLAIIVPLHSGFQFGLTVHTLAYALMVIVILSGIWGAIQYRTLAPEVPSHRGGLALKKLLEQEILLGKEMDAMTKDRSDDFVALSALVKIPFHARLSTMLRRDVASLPLESMIANRVAELPESERPSAVTLVGIAHKRGDVIRAIQREVRVLTGLKLWLYLHLPLSFALLVAVIIHIFAVFHYF